MGSLGYLFAAFAVIWIALLLYSFSIGTRQRALEREIDLLKAMLEERVDAHG